MGSPPKTIRDCKNKKSELHKYGIDDAICRVSAKGPRGCSGPQGPSQAQGMPPHEENTVFRLCAGQTASSLLGLVMDNEKQGIPPEEGCQDCELTGTWDSRRANGTGSISPEK